MSNEPVPRPPGASSVLVVRLLRDCVGELRAARTVLEGAGTPEAQRALAHVLNGIELLYELEQELTAEA
ncbi:MAG TPA: hypothetical protein VIN09_09220 [Chloroflexota bacterium]